METITTYKANDGTIFEDEQDCRAYENSLFFKSIEGCKFWDVEEQPITSVDVLAQEVVYAYFDSTEHLNQFNDFMEHNGYHGASCVNNAKPGFYWTEDGDFWTSYDREKANLEDLASRFNLE